MTIRLDLSPEEFAAIRQALDQYVENGTSALVEDPYEDPLLAPAEAVLERVNEVYAASA